MTFDLLTPFVAVEAIESVIDIPVEGALTNFTSYVNRVYGFAGSDGFHYIAKFYRPGRWSREAIVEEHRLVAECEACELPVVSPLPSIRGDTLHSIKVRDHSIEQEFYFAVYPRKGGRNFDTDRDQDWVRIGSLVGRMHAAFSGSDSSHRLVWTPELSTKRFSDELLRADVVHHSVSDEFFELVAHSIELCSPLFDGVTLQPLHGDFHRGNILDRIDEGLVIIDFDDLMIGPPVQDLWLLLPGRIADSRRELSLLVEGYEQFQSFDWRTVSLIEPLSYGASADTFSDEKEESSLQQIGNAAVR